MTTIKFDIFNPKKGLEEIERYKQELIAKNNQFVKELTEQATQSADLPFVMMDWDDEPVKITNTFKPGGNVAKGTVIESGKDATFIEFGTGIYWNENRNYPEADEMGMTIGGYGKHKGSNPKGWVFYSKNRKHPIRTKGIRANKLLYNAYKEVKEDLVNIAKGVFRK